MIDVSALRAVSATTQEVAAACTEGISHAESLLAPGGIGNGMNWVLGHMVHVNEAILQLLGARGVLEPDELVRYAPGAPPIGTGDARSFPWMRETLLAQTPLLDAAWAAVSQERLQSPPPPGFDGVLSDFLRFIVFHQAYHTGQCGTLRRQLGKAPGFG